MSIVEDSAATFLATKPAVVAVLGKTPGDQTPYLFQGSLWTVMENTQSTACVVSYAGGWINPNAHNTMRFPRLRVAVYADPLRDGNHNPIDPVEVRERVMHAYEVIDGYLHRPQGRAVMWGAMRVLGSLRMTEPTIEPEPDGTGLLRLTVTYAVTEG